MILKNVNEGQSATKAKIRWKLLNFQMPRANAIINFCIFSFFVAVHCNCSSADFFYKSWMGNIRDCLLHTRQCVIKTVP